MAVIGRKKCGGVYPVSGAKPRLPRNQDKEHDEYCPACAAGKMFSLFFSHRVAITLSWRYMSYKIPKRPFPVKPFRI